MRPVRAKTQRADHGGAICILVSMLGLRLRRCGDRLQYAQLPGEFGRLCRRASTTQSS